MTGTIISQCAQCLPFSTPLPHRIKPYQMICRVEMTMPIDLVIGEFSWE